jgi:hypothetical protein
MDDEGTCRLEGCPPDPEYGVLEPKAGRYPPDRSNNA